MGSIQDSRKQRYCGSKRGVRSTSFHYDNGLWHGHLGVMWVDWWLPTLIDMFENLGFKPCEAPLKYCGPPFSATKGK
jgi:hypothetical protein